MTPSIPSGSEPMRWRCSSPCRPCSRAALITSHGVDSSASCLAATGRITSRGEAPHLRLELELLLVEREIHACDLLEPCLRADRLTGQSIAAEAYTGAAGDSAPSRALAGSRRLACAPVLSSIRYFLADVGHWLGSPPAASRRRSLVVALAGSAVGVYLARRAGDDDGDERRRRRRRRPQVVVARGAGPRGDRGPRLPGLRDQEHDPGRGRRPDRRRGRGRARRLSVDRRRRRARTRSPWSTPATGRPAIAAASLVAAPVGAPILVTDGGEVPALTDERARARSRPEGSAATAGRQVFVVGAAAAPEGFETLEVEGAERGRDRGRDRRAARAARRQARAHAARRSSDEPALRDAGGRLGGALGRPGAVREPRRASRRRPRGAAAHDGRPGLRARAGGGDLGDRR